MLKSITWTFNQWNETADGLRKREPFWNVLFCSCLTALPLPSPLCFCSASYLTSCANLPRLSINAVRSISMFPSRGRRWATMPQRILLSLLWINSLNFFFFFYVNTLLRIQCPAWAAAHTVLITISNQQQSLPFPVLAILGKPPFFCPIYRGWWDASISWCWFILKLFIVPLFKYKSIMC